MNAKFPKWDKAALSTTQILQQRTTMLALKLHKSIEEIEAMPTTHVEMLFAGLRFEQDLHAWNAANT